MSIIIIIIIIIIFTISVLGSFTCITQHTGPTALRPIWRTKQLWLSVLLKDTSAATGQAGIRTHILATPELEYNALDRSATPLHYIQRQLVLYQEARADTSMGQFKIKLQFTQEYKNSTTGL